MQIDIIFFLLLFRNRIVANILSTRFFSTYSSSASDSSLMIHTKIDGCFDIYKEKDIRTAWSEDKEVFQSIINARRKKHSMNINDIKRFATEEEMKKLEEYFDDKRKWQGD